MSLSLEMEKSYIFPNSGHNHVSSMPTRFSGIDLSTNHSTIIVDQLYQLKS